MTHHEPFPAKELESRLAAVRKLMAEQQLDGLVVAVPENIYYLTGLDHWGFFACHVLIVPLEGEMTLIARAMERVTVERQVKNAAFIGHGDDEEPADAVVAGLKKSKLDTRRLGMEKRSLFLTPRIEYPGFGPFIRPTHRLNEEHTTWKGEVFKKGGAVSAAISRSLAPSCAAAMPAWVPASAAAAALRVYSISRGDDFLKKALES